ncbi:MAG TPA: alpha-glucan family phosphorylase [Anaerolineales bacterium]|nr:alpha-glucan family phosphorylase [Anaerolineales bacterium]
MSPDNQMELAVPRALSKLPEIARNLYWAWNQDAQFLFIYMDKQLWEEVNHNPIRFLALVPRSTLNAALRDDRFMELYKAATTRYEKYLNATNTWFNKTYPDFKQTPIAYFSPEFGLHESLPIYAGGLGILSGDHTKEASDIGLPFVGVGFIYQQGYFRQKISEDGWQIEYWDNLEHALQPISPALDPQGNEVEVEVGLPGRNVYAKVWRLQVGRVPLYLMDTNLPHNNPEDRELTHRLYSSNLDVRIAQEIVLGIGGVRALRKLGINPGVWHMNEGHSSFMILERMAEWVEQGLSYEQAQIRVKDTTVFTTHTPVPAGNEAFPDWLIDRYFPQYWTRIGLTREQFINLARMDQPWGPTFSMPTFALAFSKYANGVSELHGKVSREMWQHLYPDKAVNDVPIGSVTNGVHTDSYLARRYQALFDKYLGKDWRDKLDDPDTWKGLLDVPDEEYWEVHRHLKRKLQAFMRDRGRKLWVTTQTHPVQIIAGGALLDHNALTIGFARRFATYKRAGLIMRDFDRLLALLRDSQRPLQIIFAGKAHPADEPGKRLIQQAYQAVKRAETAGRLVFLEDYDQNVARHLVQGCDVWLNTPRRPHEASGTSGQKAALNGVLNLSILDGWWPEGYNGHNGWSIGTEEQLADQEAQDSRDAESLFSILENEVVPTFYKRDNNNVPHDWIRMMKESMMTLLPAFSTRRMLKDYTNQLYIPAMRNSKK